MREAFFLTSIGLDPELLRFARQHNVSMIPDARLITSGGVTQQMAADCILAGADVPGIGHNLLPLDAIRTRNSNWIHELAAALSNW